MEDIIKTILDVVRVQHSATEGTNEKPFDMDDVVDMTLGVMGRPESPEETATMTDSIQKMVETLAPDLFPPKTLEEMDDAQRGAFVTSMLENRLLNGFTPRSHQEEKPVEDNPFVTPEDHSLAGRGPMNSSAAPPYARAATGRSGMDTADSQSWQQTGDVDASAEPDPATFDLPQEQFQSIMEGLQAEGLTAGIDPRQTAELNDMIYKNLMEIMGAQQPRVEFPFDRSQIRYGKEKSITEQLAEEEAEKQAQNQRESQLRNSLKAQRPSQPESPAQPQNPSQPGAAAQAQAGFQAGATAQAQAGFQSGAAAQVQAGFQSGPASQAQAGFQPGVASQAQAGFQPGAAAQAQAGFQPESSPQIPEPAQTASSGKPARPKVSAADLAQSMIEKEEPSQFSAWDLALNAVTKDEEKNKKEPYKPKPVEEPKTKSASQLAAEAIARAQEEDRMKLEIEKQAEALMAEAQKRGQDPMKFALHQQEILRYMEKNSDELVSFEDYEDLSPEEKLEVERQVYIEKQIAQGVDPDKVDTQVPEEYIPSELKAASAAPAAAQAGDSQVGQPGAAAAAGDSPGSQAAAAAPPVMTEEMLRMLSQEVVRENAAMILAENADEDMTSLEEMIFQNLKKTMGGSGVPVPPEDVGDLIEQAITANRESQIGSAAPATENMAAAGAVTTGGGSGEAKSTAGSEKARTGTGSGGAPTKARVASGQTPQGQAGGPAEAKGTAGSVDMAAKGQAKNPEGGDLDTEKTNPDTEKRELNSEITKAPEQAAGGPESATDSIKTETKGLSAVELARAAQKAAKIEPKTERKTVSAADLARQAQENALRAKLNPQPVDGSSVTEKTGTQDGPSSGTADNTGNASPEGSGAASAVGSPESSVSDGTPAGSPETSVPGETAIDISAEDITADDILPDEIITEDILTQDMTGDDISTEETEADIEEEYEYVDPDELVLGEHTQAEVDEALENLSTLGLEGEVYERAKRMLLLELAGSEAELEAWLRDQETKKTRSAASPRLKEETIDDINDLDEDALERELELAMDEDFLVEDFLDEEEEEIDGQTEEPEAEDILEDNLTGVDGQTESVEDEGTAETDSQAEPAHGEESVEADSQTEPDEDVSEDDDQPEQAKEADAEEESDAGKESDVEDLVEEEQKDHEQARKVEDGIIDVEAVDDDGEVIEIITEADEEDTADIDESDAPIAQDSTDDSSEAATASKDRGSHRKKVFRKRERSASRETKDRFAEGSTDYKAEEKSYQVSTRKPFVLKNSASFMDQFEDYITDTQENRRLSTGFKKLDAMLRYGLHKGTYFIDARPQYLKNSFMQQIADRAAESGIDVLYISTELSRYDLMVETISRLSYEIHQKDPSMAVSPMAIMTGEDGAELASLKDELNWYRGRISEHLFILDQESVSDYAGSSEAQSAGDVLIELISSIVREGAHKPVVVIDNIENIISTEDSEDMKPFMEGMGKLAKELGIPILMSYGYAQAESEEELYPEEKEYHEHLGNMCDVYLELVYADMISEDMMPLTEEDVREMAQEGESLLINILLHKNRRPMKATLQIQGTPKYNFFEE